MTGWEVVPSYPPEDTNTGWDTEGTIPADQPGRGWEVLTQIFLGLEAQGNLNLSPKARIPAAMNLGAIGQLNPGAYARIPSIINLTGSGELIINAMARKQVDIAMTAEGLLAMDVYERRTALMDMAANGLLSFGVSQAVQVALSMVANGQLSLNAFSRMAAAMAMDSTGSLDLGGFARKTAGKSFFDYFNRADDFSGISNGWVARYGTMGVYANGVVPVAGNQWNESTAPIVMDSNDMEVSFTLGVEYGTGFDYTTILLGCNESGEGAFIFFNGAGGVTIYSQTGWGAAGLVVQNSIGISQITGDRWTVKRVGNLYTVLKNNVSIGLSWADTGNIIPRDVDHRLVGVAAYTDGTNARTIEDFTAVDFKLFSAVGTLAINALARKQAAMAMAANGLLSISAGFPVTAEVTAQFTATGAYTYNIPYWSRYIDPVLIGGGGGGKGFGIAGSWTDGGLGGIWDYTTWQRGVHIPWSTTQITGVVGVGGTGGAGGSGGNGGNGGATTTNAVAGGSGARSAAGGLGSTTRTLDTAGKPPNPQTVTHNGKNYDGGAQVGPGIVGNPPGGGGGGTTTSFANGSAGARGQAWFRAYQ